MAYDRNVVVNCITRHYDLLIRMAYLDPAAVRPLPLEGWSDDELAVRDIFAELHRVELR
jgi:hypothetical protein